MLRRPRVVGRNGPSRGPHAWQATRRTTAATSTVAKPSGRHLGAPLSEDHRTPVLPWRPRHQAWRVRSPPVTRRNTSLGGIAGPVAFAVASVLAARRQPDYSPVRDHVSGLAALGTDSARIMVPGFLALGAGQLALADALARSNPPRGLATGVRVAGLTSMAAGLCQASSPECPLPFEPEARPTDLAHGTASVATFLLWMALPMRAARRPEATSGWPGWHARLSRVLAVANLLAFAAAGATTGARSPYKGLAQRVFLGTALGWLVATSLAVRRAGGSAGRDRGALRMHWRLRCGAIRGTRTSEHQLCGESRGEGRPYGTVGS